MKIQFTYFSILYVLVSVCYTNEVYTYAEGHTGTSNLSDLLPLLVNFLATFHWTRVPRRAPAEVGHFEKLEGHLKKNSALCADFSLCPHTFKYLPAPLEGGKAGIFPVNGMVHTPLWFKKFGPRRGRSIVKSMKSTL